MTNKERLMKWTLTNIQMNLRGHETMTTDQLRYKMQVIEERINFTLISLEEANHVQESEDASMEL